MAKDPAFLFYSADFMVDTAHMTAREVGQFVRLLCIQHQHGCIRPEFLTQVLKGGASARVLAMFNVDGGGCLYNEKLKREMVRRKRHGRGGAVHAQWRKQVLERDGRRCTECGETRRLQAHHVIPWAETSDGDPLRYDPNNGVTLCINCHYRIHGRRHKRGMA